MLEASRLLSYTLILFTEVVLIDFIFLIFTFQMMNIMSGLITLFVVLIITTQILCVRRKENSIMEIMNTRHIERTFAERRLNASREEKRALLQNDVDEDTGDGTDIYQTPEVSIDFNLSHRRPSNRPMDILMHYNDSYIPYTPVSSVPDSDLADLQSFRSDKLLKSSKNALFVTRKEYLKKDWCKTEPLIQRVREDGCLSRNIMNRFCYGQCNSFYIPKSPKRNRMTQLKRLYNSINEFEPEDLTEAAFRSCAFCKPKKLTWITVTLRCPSLVPQLRRKKIQRIKQCKCIAEPLN